ncbi:MAG TPA: group 1 truncated hemoglobin [Streptosporangiaceae bacterium]|nr:group 1 truncated hemoglobin [Streptosporangiaceae bacterium]
MTTDVSLYDLLSGDRHPMHAVTTALYKKILADELLAPYFRGVDMDRQASMLAEFLAMAFGGPHAYYGRDLRTAHAHLAGLTDTHFDLVVAYLADTLREFGVGDGDIATAAAVAETVRDDVLNR